MNRRAVLAVVRSRSRWLAESYSRVGLEGTVIASVPFPAVSVLIKQYSRDRPTMQISRGYVVTRGTSGPDAGALANADVDEQVALLWGGRSNLETFREHYRGEASPAAQRRERGKVDWL